MASRTPTARPGSAAPRTTARSGARRPPARTAGRRSWAATAAYVAIHPIDPEVLYASAAGFRAGQVDEWRPGLGSRRRRDRRGPQQLPVHRAAVMDPTDEQRLWAGGSFVWRTDDEAGQWDRASTKLAGQSPSVSAIGTARSNPNRVLVGTGEGYIHRTSAALSANGNSGLAERPPAPGVRLLAGLRPEGPERRLRHLLDLRRHPRLEERRTAAPPGWGSMARARENCRTSRCTRSWWITGTARGCGSAPTSASSSSTDGGATWAVENTGFANVMTEWLTLADGPGAGTLFAFTHGRGAWKVAIQP